MRQCRTEAESIELGVCTGHPWWPPGAKKQKLAYTMWHRHLKNLTNLSIAENCPILKSVTMAVVKWLALSSVQKVMPLTGPQTLSVV